MKNLDNRGSANPSSAYNNKLSAVLNKPVRASQNYNKNYDQSLGGQYQNHNSASMPLSPGLDDKSVASRYQGSNANNRSSGNRSTTTNKGDVLERQI